MQNQSGQNQSGQNTGTRNETYDLISVLYHALQGAENCQTYANDAKDSQTRDFFQKAMQQQRQLADQGKQILQQCLQKDTGGQSAFGWGQSGSSSQGQSGSTGQSGKSSQNQSNYASTGAGQSTGGSSS